MKNKYIKILVLFTIFNTTNISVLASKGTNNILTKYISNLGIINEWPEYIKNYEQYANNLNYSDLITHIKIFENSENKKITVIKKSQNISK